MGLLSLVTKSEGTQRYSNTYVSPVLLFESYLPSIRITSIVVIIYHIETEPIYHG